MRILSSRQAGNLERLRERSRMELRRAEKVAGRIIDDVRRRGDRGLLHWHAKLDGPAAGGLAGLVVGRPGLRAAWGQCDRELRRALREAARNIERVAQGQMPHGRRRIVRRGVEVGHVVRPLESVACYVPGGRHPLPSTVLMTALPARIAGVGQVVVACPKPSAAVLAAAHLADVDRVYCLGGAQAIAALAYGTETIPRVGKIVGPGNLYVTAAKRLVAADCGIDFLAGPTELVVVAAPGANAAFLAADLIAQAEHDPRAAAWLLTPSRRLASEVARTLESQLGAAPNLVARKSLRSRGAILVTRDLDEAFRLANRIAPEHIVVPPGGVDRVENAGSIFVGEYSAPAAGDYATGANHVLPTAGVARWRGGLSVVDFLKVITVQEVSRAGLRRLAPAITTLARAEGLAGHARSVAIRLEGEDD